MVEIAVEKPVEAESIDIQTAERWDALHDQDLPGAPWLEWRREEGLPVTEPYPIAKLGHTGYIRVPEGQNIKGGVNG